MKKNILRDLNRQRHLVNKKVGRGGVKRSTEWEEQDNSVSWPQKSIAQSCETEEDNIPCIFHKLFDER
jgi:hypothetical protein